MAADAGRVTVESHRGTRSAHGCSYTWPPRFGNGPNDRRLTPDVLSRGTWLPLGVDVGILVGVGSSPVTEDAAEPLVRLRDLIVIEAGMLVALYTLVLGEARGGVRVGPGSLDRTECTRASSRCICAVRVRIWVSEFEVGSLFEAERGPTARWAGVRIVVVPPVEMRLPGARVVAVGGLERGRGVVLISVEGRRERLTVLRWAEGLEAATLGRGAETSDMGGEGGSGSSERVSPSSVIDLESIGRDGGQMSGLLLLELVLEKLGFDLEVSEFLTQSLRLDT
ncbi:hypothetical protein HG531_011316 [Fusarium graminearum]|nr:hypothetical protein HG531_011316 [Fusarium graminearum]